MITVNFIVLFNSTRLNLRTLKLIPMMRRNIVSGKKTDRGYEVFKEYPVTTKKKKKELEEHYVVPWELHNDISTKR